MSEAFDLAVIGAGPAGLSAATTAAGLGLRTVLLDEQATPGGQIYRNIEASPLAGRNILGPDYRQGATLAAAFRAGAADYRPQASVWQVTPEGEVGYLQDGRSRFLTAERIVLAVGAQERPFPIPGWTLPGVMGAGAAQILLKSAGFVPAGRSVLAGCGPLLWLLAWQLLKAGTPPLAVLETRESGALQRALPQLPRALGAAGYLAKGLRLMGAVIAVGIPVIRGVSGLRALGETQVTGVEYQRKGDWHSLVCDLLLLHHGVVPNVAITQALGCAHRWDEGQLCWLPECDPWGVTDRERIAVAGDSAGIGGAAAAEHSGRLAALGAACVLGGLTAAERDRQAAPARAALQRDLRIRPFLEALYRPADSFRRPPDDATLVCRCEEVTAGEIRRVVALGCQGPNQTKSFTRCGMGPCQGRLCGLTVSELIAAERGLPVAEVGHYRSRPPLKPITLGQLAETELATS